MRCKCCNEIMTEAEIIWYEERKEHEEFCASCKSKLFDDLDEYGLIVDTNDEDIPK